MTNNEVVEQPKVVPNEVSTGRWVGFFFATAGAAFVVQTLSGLIMVFWHLDGVWSWLPEVLMVMIGFALSLLFATLFLHTICKTSLHDFILGYGGKVNWNQCGKVAVAWVIGFLAGWVIGIISALIQGADMDGIALNDIGAVPILVNFLICVALLWTQTTFEEVLCRCTFLRAVCGNHIRPTVSCIVWGIVASLLFMSLHGANPEVLSQADPLSIVAALTTYFLAGISMYMADVVYKNCMPGCVIHWVNNFVLFVFFTQAGTAVESGALFRLPAGNDAGASLLGTIVLYIPLIVLLIVEAVKSKKNAQGDVLPQ